MINLTLADLAAETQRQMDDCSNDEKYVIADPAERESKLSTMGIHYDGCESGAGCELGTGSENNRRALMLQFAAVQAVAFWRANGGVGRCVCWCEVCAPGQLWVRWRAIRSMQEMFDFVRERARSHLRIVAL